MRPLSRWDIKELRFLFEKERTLYGPALFLSSGPGNTLSKVRKLLVYKRILCFIGQTLEAARLLGSQEQPSAQFPGAAVGHGVQKLALLHDERIDLRKCIVATVGFEGGAYFVRIGRVVVQHAGCKMIKEAGGFIELLFEPMESGLPGTGACKKQADGKNRIPGKSHKKCAGLIFTGI